MRCKNCGSRARPVEVWEGVLKINHKGKLVDYDPLGRWKDQCPNCGTEVEE